MSEETKKKYRVLKAVAISGIVQRGVIVELTESEAANIGIGEYLEEVSDEETASTEAPEAGDEAAGAYEKEPEDEGSEGEQKTPEGESNGSAEAGTGGEEGTGD